MDVMALTVRELHDLYWSESFWLPHNVTWADFEGTDTMYIPKARDLWISLPTAVLLFICRLVWEHYVALPVGRYFRLKEEPPKKAAHQSLLEQTFKRNERLPPHQFIRVLGKKIDWSPRQIERWWRRRRVQHKPSSMQPWRETSWRFVFYSTMFWYGVIALWNKPCFWDTKQCWQSYPKQHVELEIRLYYTIQLGFYFSLLLSLFKDTKRKDFAVQMLHHFVTIVILFISWSANLVRAGAITAAIHDAVDWLLEWAKLAKYAKFHRLCDHLFVVLALVWFIAILGLYPLKVLRSTLFEGHAILGSIYPIYIIHGILLCGLQVLHLVWFQMICSMLYVYVKQGKVGKDDRSETEPETNSDDNGNLVAKDGLV